MTRRFRCTDPEQDLQHWFEVGDDGRVLRQATFDSRRELPPLPEWLTKRPDETSGAASVAASRAYLTATREEHGPLAGQLYEAVYGVLVEGPVEEPPEAVPVTEEGFEQAWRAALRDRHFSRYDTGPLPQGARLTGTVSALPWGPGLTGMVVDIGRPVGAFVDVLHLPREAEDWPAVGTVTEFEVVTIRFYLEPGTCPGLQLRLRPTATPAPGEPWPSPVPR
ncbi:hypothetical protein [Streptomyces torulosus]|uniref:hypothetical protein n=1 Tax=Streptomyces torulosus TaxID=68276 RepID=UPI0012FF1FDD|nr:hypothetical protein [Streptomyces torulosus]